MYTELVAGKVRILTQVVVIQSHGSHLSLGPRAAQFSVAVSGGMTKLAAFLSCSFPLHRPLPTFSLFFNTRSLCSHQSFTSCLGTQMNHLRVSWMKKVAYPREVTAAESTCYKSSPCQDKCLRAAGPKWRMDIPL